MNRFNVFRRGEKQNMLNVKRIKKSLFVVVVIIVAGYLVLPVVNL